MSPPRIALVSHELAPFYGAGIAVHAHGLARALRDVGCDVTIITGPHPGLSGTAHQRRLALESAGLAGVEVRTVGLAQHAAKAGATWNHGYAEAVAHEVRVASAPRPFDAIEYPEFGGEGAMLSEVRGSGAIGGPVLIVRLHTSLRRCVEFNRQSIVPGLHERVFALEDRSILGADAVVSPTRWLLDLERSRLQPAGSWPRAEAVIANPFDVQGAACSLGAEREVVFDHPTVLHIGRLERRKGVEMLVRASLGLMDAEQTKGLWHVRFVGSDTPTADGGGSMLAHLRATIEGHRNGCHRGRFAFMGPLPRSALGPLIRGCTCVCVASVFENFPSVVLEAMSLGAVVVASDASGPAEMVLHGSTGLLANCRAASGLADAIGSALASSSLVPTCRERGPARVRELADPERVARRMLALVTSLAGAGAGAV